jgi:hypothetical protein
MPFESLLLSLKYLIFDVLELFIGKKVGVEFKSNSIIGKSVNKIFEIGGMILGVKK